MKTTIIEIIFTKILEWSNEDYISQAGLEVGLEEGLNEIFTKEVADYLFDVFNGSENPSFTVESLEVDRLRKKIKGLEEKQANEDIIEKENKSLKEKLKSTLEELEKLKKDLMKGSTVS